MARTVREAKLETRTARDRLKAGETVHWRTLVPGQLHLGYRRRSAGIPGAWTVRLYVGKKADEKGSPYQKKTLGIADDFPDADGRGVLSFADAQRLAHEYAADVASPAAARQKVPTVREAMAEYVTHLKLHKKSGDEAERRADAFVLPTLGYVRIDQLTLRQLESWRNDLVAQPARLRTGHKKGPDGRATGDRKEQRYRAAPATEAEKRARRATVNRTVTVLKAALNMAIRGTDLSDRAWHQLKPLPNTHAARPGHLTVAEAQRLVNAADASSGFRDMVRAALLTGCRYGELCRLLVGDFGRGRLEIRESKSGRPRDVLLTEEGVAFFSALVAGRPAGELMLRHPDGSAWAKNHQSRPMLEACRAAGVQPAVGFHQLRHTWASLSVMGGMQLMLVAENLGHADTRMVERHYGHLTDDYRDQMIRDHAPRFGIVPPAPVVSLDDHRQKEAAR